MYIEKIIEERNQVNNSHNMVSTSYGYDHMVYVRLFEGCNLHCEHCFIPSNPKKIDSQFYENKGLTNELMKNRKITEGSRLYIQWHGGEPTLLGVNYLKNAINEVNKDSRFKYMHGIQTNLMNFHQNTEQWIELYKTHFDSQLGISWDYAIRHTKSASKTPEETNQDFENQFWQNVKLATDSGLELYMVVTATKLFFEHFKNPYAFFEMMVEKKITKLNFERVTKTGYARESWNKIGLNNEEYSRYMSKFFKAYSLFKKNNMEINLHISPFDGLLRSVLDLELRNREEEKKISKEENKEPNKETANVWDIMSYKNQGYGCWSGECDTRFHTIDSNGYKHGCTALTSEQDNKNKKLNKTIDVKNIVWIGKLKTSKENLDQKDVKSSQIIFENQGDAIIEERKFRQQSCAGCEFLSICSSGCLSVEKFDESGECSGAKKLFKTINNTVNMHLSIIEENNELKTVNLN